MTILLVDHDMQLVLGLCCLGSHLARRELRVPLRKWHQRIPDYEVKRGIELHYPMGLRFWRTSSSSGDPLPSAAQDQVRGRASKPATPPTWCWKVVPSGIR